MELEIKSMFSADNTSFKQWKPERLEDIYFVLEMEIGQRNKEGSELFQTVIASPEAIRSREKYLAKFISGREYILVFSYSWKSIDMELNKIVERCCCDTWEESVIKLSRYFLWEYEDHEYVEL